MTRFFPSGKLPPDILEGLLSKIPKNDHRLITGPKIGEDAAVLDMGDCYLVTSTDPITFATQRIGWYAVHVNANDIAVKGATPRWFQAVLLLPEGKANKKMVQNIFSDILESCRSLNIALIGGHTEVTPGLDRPLVIGQMMGEVAKDRYIALDNVQPGDEILMAEHIAIEGTAILATEKRMELSPYFDEEILERASRYLLDPGISVVQAAKIACQAGPVHGMHDPTEGGLITALWELGQACDCGLLIHENLIPVLPETQNFCRHFGLDPLGLIASGALLIVTASKYSEQIVSALEKERIPCTVIGAMTQKSDGFQMMTNDEKHPFRPLLRDEITKIL